MATYNEILKQIRTLRKDLNNPTKEVGPIRKQISILQDRAEAILDTTKFNIETDETTAIKNTRELLQLKESLLTATGPRRSQLRSRYINLANKIAHGNKAPADTSSGPYNSPIITQLTSGYALEEDTEPRVDFKGLLNLDTAVSAPSSAAGKIGNALSGLTGDEYVSGTGSTAIYHGLSQLSVNYWIYASSTMSTFSHAMSIGDNWELHHQGNGSNSTTTYKLYVGGGKWAINQAGLSISGSVWRMFTVTYDGSLANGSMCKWYVDGVLQAHTNASAGLSTTVVDTNNVFRIGAANNGGQPMTGGSLIDQLSTYAGYVLTQGDVSNLYNNGAGVAFEKPRTL